MKKKMAIAAVALAVAVGGTVYAFNDVIQGTQLEKAVDQMTDFNIVNGYEDGSFRPENNITRAEFSKIIIETIMTEERTTGEEAKFSDVAENHWAKNYIYLSRKLGIVNGVTEDTFSPESNITYEQAIKMIVAALGYEQQAQELGGYPHGYMIEAQELKITEGIKFNDKDYATRGNIVLMLNNAMNIPYNIININEGETEFIKSELTLYERHMAAKSISDDGSTSGTTVTDQNTSAAEQPESNNSSDAAEQPVSGTAVPETDADSESEAENELIEKGILKKNENGVYDNEDLIDTGYADSEVADATEEPLSTEHMDEFTDETEVSDFILLPESADDLG